MYPYYNQKQFKSKKKIQKHCILLYEGYILLMNSKTVNISLQLRIFITKDLHHPYTCMLSSVDEAWYI